MKLSLFALLALMSLRSFATAPALILYPGEERTFNVTELSDFDEPTALIEFSLTQKLADQTLPVVEVVEQIDGFTCQIESLKKVSSFFFMSKVRETYNAQISWVAGQHWSSCTVEISHNDFLSSKVFFYTE